MKQIIAFMIALFAILPAFSHDVKGRILNESNAPLDYVNVMLLKADSTYISGTVTDDKAGSNYSVTDVRLIPS